MSIYIDENTKVLVQGITGRDGSFHTQQMLDYGTQIVAGVTPGKGGQFVGKIPIFNTVKEAVDVTDANTSVIFVPAQFATDAIYEAIDSGIKLIVCITEGIPVIDTLKIYNYIKTKKEVRLIGPNCPGIISPGKSKVGIIPGHICKSGNIGIVSRSGTLTYEILHQLTKADLGQSTCLGIGGDPIVGTSFIDAIQEFEKDPETSAIVIIGEIGGDDEEKAAEFVKENIKKPTVAFVAGKTAPPEKRMGHAGAIISGGKGSAQEKIEKFKECGVLVADLPQDIPQILKRLVR